MRLKSIFGVWLYRHDEDDNYWIRRPCSHDSHDDIEYPELEWAKTEYANDRLSIEQFEQIAEDVLQGQVGNSLYTNRYLAYKILKARHLPIPDELQINHGFRYNEAKLLHTKDITTGVIVEND